MMTPYRQYQARKSVNLDIYNLDNILEDQKDLAEVMACLEEEDPPYMTIKAQTNSVNTVKERATPFDWTSQEKLQPLGKDESSGLSLHLGAEYEKKKQKLQEELRSDYRRYVAEKKDLHTVETDARAPGLSLPIDERRIAKDRLRDERNKEYNLFIKGSSGQPTRSSKAAQFQAPKTLNSHPAILEAQVPHPWDPLPSKKDAATLTDRKTGTEGSGPRERRRWDLQRTEESLEQWESRRPRRRSIRREQYNSPEYLSTEEEDFEFLERRRPRKSREPEFTERERRVYDRPDRVMRGRRQVEPAVVREEDMQDHIRKFQSATPKPNSLVTPVAMKTAERSRSAADKDRGLFATGLMIGTADEEEATQRRKDRYRQELLEQMEEGRRNKRKEKDLDLRVAATGAVDPEKQPDRIKQFGVVNRNSEGQRRDIPNWSPRPRQQRPDVGTESVPPGRPRAAFPSLPMTDVQGQLPWAGAPLNENFPRGLSGSLAEMIVPRIANLPPSLPPTLTNGYQTSYDEACNYYGVRNPLDPVPPYYGPLVSDRQSQVLPHLPPGMIPQPGHLAARRTNQHPVSLPDPGMGSIRERPKQSNESAWNYQEALRQQIMEKEGRKREEREASNRYNAKIEAESRTFDPWGKEGGGAPLRDDRGNLISDLNRMHRNNEEAYVNPESRDRGKPRVSAARRGVGEGVGGEGGGPTHTGEEVVLSSHRLSGLSQPSQFARGNMFSDQRTPKQLQDQGTYKDFLKQQIEDKRRREAAERERKRMEEEREEKRLAEQRVCIQKEFEQDQDRRRRKEVEQSSKNEELIRQAEERRKDAERKRKEEEERESEILRKQIERERQALKADRGNSPLVPALQNKLDKHLTPRPPGPANQFSSRSLSGRSVSAPHSPPVPARKKQLRETDEKPRGVIRELSTLRRQLRSEQRRLEGQLLQRDRKETDTAIPSWHSGHLHGNAFEVARGGAGALSRRGAARVNKQNIREFNLLKHRDSASCEDVRNMYPDPPSEDQSLDIQQRAQLRRQQSRIRDMKSRREPDHKLSVERQPRRRLRDNPGHQRVRSLESESAFIDHPNGGLGSMSPAQVDLNTRQPGPETARRPLKRRDFKKHG
ncbi:hypothetical protein DPEC_G00077820 [Dallia pectoralis]|uniref:Uncharacterized protein n=1 Tax=Dallia pectoralis TaxID=75939 RepID=A0ACC2H496_DALPE|nr:hypothetical protein DPEC_G00077820 [Dallia pectoralis]